MTAVPPEPPVPLPLVFGLLGQPRPGNPGPRTRAAPTRSMVLRALYELGSASRADVARQSGLARGTVSQAVEALDRELLIVDGGRDPSKRPGKPSTLLALRTDHHVVVCIDISEPYAWSISALTLAGFEGPRSTGTWQGPDDLVEQVVAEARETVRRFGDRAACIAIAVPGVVDQRGEVVLSHLTGGSAAAISRRLRERDSRPVVTVNDANAAALASHDFTSPSSSLVIRIGLGLGAGLVVDRRVVHGPHNSAGEIGRLRVAGGGTLNDRVTSDILRAVYDDPAASSEIGQILGEAVAPVVATLDLDRVVVSGIGVSVSDAFLASAKRAIDASLLDADLGVQVVAGRSDGDDVVVGTASLAFAAWLDLD